MYSPPPRDSLEKYSFVPIPPLRSGPHRPPLRLHCRPRPDLRYLGIRVVVHADRTLHALQIHRSSVFSSPPVASSATAVVAVAVAVAVVVVAATPMPASPFRTDRLISECTALGASWWDYRGSSALRNRSFQSGNRC